VLSQGGTRDGFSLYLKDGVPHVSLYQRGNLATIHADQPVTMNEPVHLVGQLNEQSELVLYVNGKTVARQRVAPLSSVPGHPLAIGRDTRDKSGEYDDANPWQSELRDIRLYAGALDVEAIRGWANQ